MQYYTQIMTIPTDAQKQIYTVIFWFLWRGVVFRVPLSTLHLDLMAGSMRLIDVSAQCTALFISRCHSQFCRNKAVAAEWFQIWLLSLQ
jgi:hypothetical protein